MDTIESFTLHSDATVIQRAVRQSNYDLLVSLLSTPNDAKVAPLEPDCAGDFAMEERKALLVQNLLNWEISSATYTVPDFTECDITLP